MTEKERLQQRVNNIFTISNELKYLQIHDKEVAKTQLLIIEKFRGFKNWSDEQIEKLK